MENNEIQISKYSRNSITINDFNQMILSFQNKQILNNNQSNDQKEFIKQLCNSDLCEYFYNINNDDEKLYQKLKVHSLRPDVYVDNSKMLSCISTDNIDMMY